ncbi:lipid II flippase MurJ [Vibrio sp. PP-XX7]
MFGLIVLSKPMLMVLFMRGEFSLADVEHASASLMAYSSGLLSFMMIKVLAPGYYSRQDTKTPVKYGVIAMVSNIFFNAIFAWFWGYVGLAIATALSALINMVLLYRGLHIAQVYRLRKATLFFILRIFTAGFVMSIGLSLMLSHINVWLTWSLLHRGMVLAGLIATGGGSIYWLEAF